MAATITWRVNTMNCYPQAEGQTDVVFTVHWDCVGSETVGANTFNGRVYNSQAVQYKEGQPYTPYNDLTQEQVLAWIWDSGVDKEATESAVLQQIENEKNPPVITPPLPWNNAA